MSPNEKSARLVTIATALEKLQKKAADLDEAMLGYLITAAAREARSAANQAIARV